MKNERGYEFENKVRREIWEGLEGGSRKKKIMYLYYNIKKKLTRKNRLCGENVCKPYSLIIFKLASLFLLFLSRNMKRKEEKDCFTFL